jgi:hypothetical protein
MLQSECIMSILLNKGTDKTNLVVPLEFKGIRHYINYTICTRQLRNELAFFFGIHQKQHQTYREKNR